MLQCPPRMFRRGRRNVNVGDTAIRVSSRRTGVKTTPGGVERPRETLGKWLVKMSEDDVGGRGARVRTYHVKLRQQSIGRIIKLFVFSVFRIRVTELHTEE